MRSRKLDGQSRKCSTRTLLPVRTHLDAHTGGACRQSYRSRLPIRLIGSTRVRNLPVKLTFYGGGFVVNGRSLSPQSEEDEDTTVFQPNRIVVLKNRTYSTMIIIELTTRYTYSTCVSSTHNVHKKLTSNLLVAPQYNPT